ncbi:MAG: hypothetical protein EOO38_11435 [Cytophagaceae bacterium]|nr:MAG: hypothetical protein EOO38_11435 [Cytophagaceae bacterium]
MTKNTKRRSFSGETRENAVKLVIEGGRKCSEVAADHDLPEGSVYAWVRQARQGAMLGANDEQSSSSELREENARLRRELKDARDKALFLQKTAAFFATLKK